MAAPADACLRRDIEDVGQHLAYGGGQPRGPLRLSAGAALLPRSITHADVAAGPLAAWGDCPERSAELRVLHSSRRRVSPKVTAFVDFPMESFPQRRL